MAHICTKKIQCEQCEHYRFDQERGRMACFMEQDQHTVLPQQDQQEEDYPIVLDTSLGKVFVSEKDGDIVIELGQPHQYPGIKMPLVILKDEETRNWDHRFIVELYNNGERDEVAAVETFSCGTIDSFFARKAKEKQKVDAKAAKRQMLINHGIDTNHVDDIMEEYERLTKIEKGEE